MTININNMNILNKLSTLFKKEQTYTISEIKSDTTDLKITHESGVIIQIEHDGTVIVISPKHLALHARGNLQISSDTHIGLKAPRIDLN